MKSGCCLALALACASPVLADPSVGVASLEAAGGDPGRRLSLSIWYPAVGGTPQEVGGNAVFVGTPAGRDAPMTEGQFPLALVSHGGLRSAPDSGAWLSAALAQAGFVAVEINGPRPRTGADAVNEIWRRPEDVTRALDVILSDPDWSDHIARSRISVVGFALGGTAALALAGGEFEARSFESACSEGAIRPDCAWFERQNATLDTVDRERLVEPRRDPRISSVVAIDPEYLDVFADGMASINAPALLVALSGDGGSSEASGNDALTRAVVPGAIGFDAFPVCTPAGAAVLAEEGGDPALCAASTEARMLAHKAIADRVASFLSEGAGATEQ